jgi:steroid 5-alpha reductase family enzyme
MYVPSAIFIALFNTVNNSINTLLFTIASSNPTYISPWCIYIGAALYTTGILIEPISEVQRANFKAKPENKGKPYAGGLLSLARNINYGAYTLWRSGMALACGGVVWGALTAAFFTWDFATRGVPVLEQYCVDKYGEQYRRIQKDVPYKLFPGIY